MLPVDPRSRGLRKLVETQARDWVALRESTCKWDENGQRCATLSGRVRAFRPSDASVVNTSEGTATDWVTRGRLNSRSAQGGAGG